MGVHVHGLRVVVVMMLHVVDSRHVGGVGCMWGRGADVRHASQGYAARCEVVQQVAIQALRRLVVDWVMVVVVRGEHRRVVQMGWGRGGGAGHACHGGHGVIGRVRFERVALLGHNVHRSQRFGSLEQSLIEPGEDVALELGEQGDSESRLVIEHYCLLTKQTKITPITSNLEN